MRVVQLVVPGASAYEQKSSRIDFAALTRAGHTVTVIDAHDAGSASGDVAHVYGSSEFRDLRMPFIASGRVARGRFRWRRVAQPRYVVSPLSGTDDEHVPEAVEEEYFAHHVILSREDGEGSQSAHPEILHSAAQDDKGAVIGTFGRPGLIPIIQQTLVRIHRFREDVTWNVFDRIPTPEDLRDVEVWVDPTRTETDFDGYVAEALVAGLPVVASRTPINVQRLEKGRTGFLVPPRDANEMTHAILAALFKPELARQKTEAARQTLTKFKSSQRLRVLTHMYATLQESA